MFPIICKVVKFSEMTDCWLPLRFVNDCIGCDKAIRPVGYGRCKLPESRKERVRVAAEKVRDGYWKLHWMVLALETAVKELEKEV
jgi:hypothetical protein